jgi:putative ABC transport system permease protein
VLKLALANIRTYSRRFIAGTLAVMIGTAFLSATLMVNSSATASLERSIGEAYQHADLVAGIDTDQPTTDVEVLGTQQLAALRAVPGVAAVEPQTTSGARIATGSGDYNAVVQPYAADAQLRTTDLVSGSAPTGGSEVTVDAKHAEQYGLHAGDTVGVTGSAPDGTALEYTATITGITTSSNSPFLGSNLQVAVSADRYASFVGSAPDYQSLMIRLDDGADPAAVTAGATDALKAHGISHPRS